MGLIFSLIIGALAGFIGSKLFQGSSNGLLVNLIVGIVGGLIGGWLIGGVLGLGGGNIIGQLVEAVIGSIILLWLISKLKIIFQLLLPVLPLVGSTGFLCL